MSETEKAPVISEGTVDTDTGEVVLGGIVKYGSIEHTPKIGRLAAALAAAQAELKDPEKDSKSGRGSKYSSLHAALGPNRPILAKHKIAVMQWPGELRQEQGKTMLPLVTMLVHESGEWIRGTAEMPVDYNARMNPNQAVVSAVSYLRRPSFKAAVGLADQDDDGEAATASPQERQQNQQQAPPRPPQAEPPASGHPPTPGSWTINEKTMACIESGEFATPYDRHVELCRCLMKEIFEGADPEKAGKVYAVNAALISELPDKGKDMLAERMKLIQNPADIPPAAEPEPEPEQ